jgi:hypothetical protein
VEKDAWTRVEEWVGEGGRFQNILTRTCISKNTLWLGLTRTKINPNYASYPSYKPPLATTRRNKPHSGWKAVPRVLGFCVFSLKYDRNQSKKRHSTQIVVVLDDTRIRAYRGWVESNERNHKIRGCWCLRLTVSQSPIFLECMGGTSRSGGPVGTTKNMRARPHHSNWPKI